MGIRSTLCGSVERIRNSGFHVHADTDLVRPSDIKGRQRLAEPERSGDGQPTAARRVREANQYLLRAPFSLQKIPWNPDTKTVVCRSRRSWHTKSNFQVFTATELTLHCASFLRSGRRSPFGRLLAAVVDHIPPTAINAMPRWAAQYSWRMPHPAWTKSNNPLLRPLFQPLPRHRPTPPPSALSPQPVRPTTERKSAPRISQEEGCVPEGERGRRRAGDGGSGPAVESGARPPHSTALRLPLRLSPQQRAVPLSLPDAIAEPQPGAS